MDSTESILKRLASEAEEHLHHDVEGRRRATLALFIEMNRLLTAAHEVDAVAYATSIEANGLVIGGYVVVKSGRDGGIVVAPVDVMGPKLARPQLKYNMHQRAWEHGTFPGLVHPLHAVLDVVLPFVFEAIRRERGMPRERAATNVQERVSQFHPPSPADPRGWLGRSMANANNQEERAK